MKIARQRPAAITKMSGRSAPYVRLGKWGANRDGGNMRRVIWTLAFVIVAGVPAKAAPTITNDPAAAAMASTRDFGTTDAVLRWINGYRRKPDLAHVPVAVRALSRLDALRESETAAVYVG